MTSEQVMLALVALCLLLCGCHVHQDPEETPVPLLVAPYGDRQVWAVAPLRNESGSLAVDGARVADHVARQLEQADGIDVLPVNRVLAAMRSLGLAGVSSPEEALRLRQALGADGLVVGTLSAYDPYDPPKLGMALELYVDPRRDASRPMDVRGLSQAATDGATRPELPTATGQPVTAVSGLWDAADPATRQLLQRYAIGRGQNGRLGEWHHYRISMDLYTEFVSYAASWRLLQAEGRRVRGRSSQEPLS